MAGKESLKKNEGKKALDYLYGRSLTDKIIDKFNIGYCPENVSHQLRGRIITPIYSTYDDLVAISSRHMDKEHKNRFWHESFDKGSYLYGLNSAKEKILETNKSIIVEGEFDVLTLHSFGLTIAVGICGSALSIFQIGLLSRFCSDFYFILDGDESGKKSMQKIGDIFKKYSLSDYGLKFFPVYLPKGLDPDDFVRKYGKNEFIQKMKNSKEDIIFD